MFPPRSGFNNKGGRGPLQIVVNLLVNSEQVRTAPAK